jgi:CubicO group peptidase (beta-lactamase class C family)
MQDGDILLNKGYGYANRNSQTPNTSQTRFQVNHITMTFTGLAVMLLYQEGKLDLKDPICNYLDNCQTGWQAFRIEDLLQANTTIPDYTVMASFKESRLKPIKFYDLIKSIEPLPLDQTYSPGLW